MITKPLTLRIDQVNFNEIIAGTKKEEYIELNAHVENLSKKEANRSEDFKIISMNPNIKSSCK